MDPATQYRAITERVAIAPWPGRSQVEVAGTDRATFLHNLCTNDIKGLTPGRGCEAFFTDVKGKIVAHGYVYCDNETLTIDTVPGAAAGLIAHLDRYLIREKAELADRSDEREQWLLAGPEATALLEKLRAAGTIVGDLPDERLHHTAISLHGESEPPTRVSLRRLDVVDRHGYSLCVDPEERDLGRTLAAAGAIPCGEEAVEIGRIEQGTPLYGRDITAANLPQEVGRDAFAVSFTKGCYLGQETVARIDALGHVNQLLRGLRFDGADVPEAGTELSVDGKAVGRVTSAAFSPRADAAVALGYLRRQHGDVGTRLSSPHGEATVVDLPMA